MELVLSLFPGIDLLGRGFEAEGFCIVRGPDLLWGGDIRAFHPPKAKFGGVIGGSPCQEFSGARRKTKNPPTGYGLEMLREFCRVVAAARPVWFLLENVPGVPAVAVDGYSLQRFTLRASECGGRQLRLRVFQFGCRDATALVCDRQLTARETAREPAALATEGKKSKTRRGFPDFCALQGLPRDFDLPGYRLREKYVAVGNGVPVYMARVLARAVRERMPAAALRLCPCMCGRLLSGAQKSAGPACRKRLQAIRNGRAIQGGHTWHQVTAAA